MPRILIAEDEADLLDMLRTLLEISGFGVATAASKRACIAQLERGAFDLVLTDLMLETRDVGASWRTIDEIVALARPTPVGILTAWPTSPAVAAEHGLAFVLAKPCSRNALLGEIARALALPPLTEEQRTAVRTYFASLAERAYDRLAALCTDDVVYQLPGTDPRFANEIRGKREFLAFTEETFAVFREPRFELGAITALPGGALVEYTGAWTQDGVPRELPGAVMFEFRDDQIARIGVRIDPDCL